MLRTLALSGALGVAWVAHGAPRVNEAGIVRSGEPVLDEVLDPLIALEARHAELQGLLRGHRRDLALALGLPPRAPASEVVARYRATGAPEPRQRAAWEAWRGALARVAEDLEGVPARADRLARRAARLEARSRLAGVVEHRTRELVRLLRHDAEVASRLARQLASLERTARRQLQLLEGGEQGPAVGEPPAGVGGEE